MSTTPAPDVVFVSGPTYLKNSRNTLIPFTYSNGKLDVTSNADWPFGSGTADVLGNGGASVRLLGGNSQVTSIGTNLKNLIYSKGTWDSQIITSNAAITVASPGFVTRVQQLSSNYLAPTWDTKSYNVAVGSWSSNGNNFIGDATVYMFNKPLVLQTSNSAGTPICITLQSSWDH